MHPPLPGDKSAGFIGLIAGAVSIFIVVYAIVLLTNRKFESHGRAAAHPPAAGAPATGAPAAGQPAGATAPAPH
ncbi:MAG: hypothetical protein ABR499_22590 [Gemmatimonadaceae bacterium]